MKVECSYGCCWLPTNKGYENDGPCACLCHEENQPESKVVPRNQFTPEFRTWLDPKEGWQKEIEHRCNYCHKLCYYGETFGHICEAYNNFKGWKLRSEQL